MASSKNDLRCLTKFGNFLVTKDREWINYMPRSSEHSKRRGCQRRVCTKISDHFLSLTHDYFLGLLRNNLVDYVEKQRTTTQAHNLNRYWLKLFFYHWNCRNNLDDIYDTNRKARSSMPYSLIKHSPFAINRLPIPILSFDMHNVAVHYNWSNWG